MKQIPLSQGMFALVDDADFEELSKFKWHATRVRSNWYAARNVRIGEKRRLLLMHRALMQPQSRMVVDHIDLNGLNNQRANLRVCTNAQNMANRPPPKNNSTGAKGVSFRAKAQRYVAQITVNGEGRYLGLYESVSAAQAAYNKAAAELVGEFARG